MTIANDLKNHGFDICHPFHPKWYNDVLREENLDLALLPETNCSAILIGNTKHLWPYFVRWFQSRESLPENPLDEYCQECLQTILSRHFDDDVCIYFSHCYTREQLVSMQRVAMVSGLAYHDSSSQLTIHPIYGTWHSFRAVAIIPSDGNVPETAPQRLPCLLSAAEKERAVIAMKYALEVSDAEKLCEQLHGKVLEQESVIRSWIALRDSIEIGKKEYRFDENQLMYHYTKDTKYIRS